MSKLKFKGKTLYTKTCVDNILDIFEEGEQDNAEWYAKANHLAWKLSAKYSVSLEKVIGIIAALSPQKSWKENMRITETFLDYGHAYHTKAMTAKAQAILDGEATVESILLELNGNKIKAFFLNILWYDRASTVTIDRHAIEIAVGKPVENHQLTVNQYQFFVNCYIIASNGLGYKPHEVQAITWTRWREIKHPNGAYR